jgi:hypothetical protein
MFIQLAVRAFRREIRKRLPNFKYLKRDFYDPNLTFDTRLREYQVSIDEKFLPNSEDWIGIIWNRDGVLPTDKPQGRPNFCIIDKNLTSNTATTYPVKWAKFPLSFSFFANSPLYLENFEEEIYFEFQIPEDRMRNVDLPILGETNIILSEITVSPPQKLERQTKGTLIQLPMTFSMTAPIVQISKKEENLPLILDVPFDIELDPEATLGQGGIYIMDC